MQQLQEESHSTNFDYRNGSPHLKHWHLYNTLVSRLRIVLLQTANTVVKPALLDVGAGEGSFVEPVLAAGYEVMAVEMSRPAINTLKARYGQNQAFRVELDPDGYLTALGTEKFGVILYTSVLHHIPDYATAVQNAVNHHLEQGGSFVSFQDPLLYSSVPNTTRLVSKIAYLWWRLKQGNLIRGFRTTIRRLRGVYDENNPSDMSEYHVIRNGVDQVLLTESLSNIFKEVELITYWSTQSSLWQWIGERLRLTNTFGIVASGFRGEKQSTTS